MSSVASRIETVFSGALTIAGLLIAVTFAHREFGSPRSAVSRAAPAPPKYIANWQRLFTDGVVLGNAAAGTKVIEFADFECPFCRAADTVLRTVIREHPADVVVVYVHFPLRMHRFAMPAARAAECAGTQGRFAQIHDLLFDRQDSLGLKSWESFARDAGVNDLAAFGQCIAASGSIPRVEAGRAAGERLHIRGTPTILVNGWLLANMPQNSRQFDSVVTALSRLPHPR